MANLKEKYNKEIRSTLKEELGIDNIRGMDVCINTSAQSQENAKALLTALDFPFKGR